ncbi:MAG: hypothetical protein ABSH21_12060 [Verrucomicrobiia bacterium]|jgi:hypothetical protein
MEPTTSTTKTEGATPNTPSAGKGVFYYARLVSGCKFDEKTEKAVGKLLEANKEVVLNCDPKKHKHWIIDLKSILITGRHALKH